MIFITDAKENDDFNDDIRNKVVETLPEDDDGVAHIYEFTDNAEEDPFSGYLVLGSPTLVYHMVRTTKDDEGETQYGFIGTYIPTVDGSIMPDNGLGQNLSDSIGSRTSELETTMRAFHRKVLERLGQPVPGSGSI